MGRHSSDGFYPSATPVLRLASPRTRPAPDRPVPGVRFPVVDDLSQIAADDRLLDYLSAGRSDYADLFAGSSALQPSPSSAVAPLLATWRSEFVEPPLPELPDLPVLPASKRLVSGPGGLPPSRSLRPILGVAAAICALLLGSAAVGAHASRPGDTLWPLTRVLYSSHARSVQAAVEVKQSMQVARHFLDTSQAPKAIPPLSSAQVQIKRVDPADGAEGLQSALTQLLGQVRSSTAKTAAVQEAQSSTEAARIAARSVAGTVGKNDSGAAKHSAAVGSAAKGGAKASGSAPTTTAVNGFPIIPGAGRIVPTVPGVPMVAPAPPTNSEPTPPGTGSVDPIITPPVVPVPVTTPTVVEPPPVEPVVPTEPANPTVVDPTTAADPPTVAPSTTSAIPTPTAAPTDTGAAQQGLDDLPSMVPAQASQ